MELNVPEDLSAGWKDFKVSQLDSGKKVTVQRWWTGKSWGKTYKDKDNQNKTSPKE